MVKNLWPEDIVASPQTFPVTILREQAGLLHRRTNGKLKGRVETKQADNGKLRHTLAITGYKMEYFRWPVMYVEHAIEGWPVEFYAPALRDGFTVDNEDDFREALGVVLQSKTVKTAVCNLMAMATHAA